MVMYRMYLVSYVIFYLNIRKGIFIITEDIHIQLINRFIFINQDVFFVVVFFVIILFLLVSSFAFAKLLEWLVAEFCDGVQLLPKRIFIFIIYLVTFGDCLANFAYQFAPSFHVFLFCVLCFVFFISSCLHALYGQVTLWPTLPVELIADFLIEDSDSAYV